ncbi:MAG: ABC transporter permease [Candidatus Rokubacteria bacterium]|nr:ABC transporter permease [Candidatus Rokubacteria bacterium]
MPEARGERGADYPWRRFRRNRLAVAALGYLIVVHLAAALAPWIVPYEPEFIDLLNQMAPPSREHLLGTDETGRDVLSRLIAGARTSLAVGLSAMVLAIAIGTALGGISGMAGGIVEVILMRVTDGMLTVPTFFLALLVLAVFGSSIVNVVLVIGATGWMVVARVVRAEVLRTLPQEFVVASRALGVGRTRILLRHLLPQALPSLIVAATLGVAYAVLTESALSYLGLGVQPPTPTWGNMLTGAQHYVWKTPSLALYPGAAIMLTVLSYNALGDALSDTLDPRHAGT